MQQVRTCPPRTLSPGRLGRSPRAAAGARTGVHMGSTRVLQTPQSRTAGPRRWPVKPGLETTPDAVLRRSVSLKPAVMQPCAVRAHRCASLACGARSARERTPLRHRGPTGSMRSYVKPCGRTPTRAVVRNSARSYLRAPLRYDRAPSGTTARPRVRPRAPGYDRASPRTTRRSRVRPRAPRRRTAGTRPPRPHPHTKGRMTPPCWDSGFDGDSMGTVMRGERSLPWDSRKYSLEWCDRATSATLGGAGGPGALRGCDPEERADLSVAAEHERPRR